MSGQTSVVLDGGGQTAYLKAGDKRPLLRGQLQQDGEPFPLDQTDPRVRRVVFRFWADDPTDPITESTTRVTRPDDATGRVVYRWRDPDVAAPGSYRGEFRVDFSDNTQLTFPNTDDLRITITDRR